jgi:hypothetical protein
VAFGSGRLGRQDLFAEDVGVAGVLSELSEHLQVEGPHRPFSATGHHGVELELGHPFSRCLASMSMGVLHRCDGVLISECEGAVDRVGDSDLGVGATRHGLVEPDPLDEGDVLEQAEERRRRRDEPHPGLVLGQAVDAGVERRAVLVDQLFEALAERASVKNAISGHER